jgi:hypothetical protein
MLPYRRGKWPSSAIPTAGRLGAVRCVIFFSARPAHARGSSLGSGEPTATVSTPHDGTGASTGARDHVIGSSKPKMGLRSNGLENRCASYWRTGSSNLPPSAEPRNARSWRSWAFFVSARSSSRQKTVGWGSGQARPFAGTWQLARFVADALPPRRSAVVRGRRRTLVHRRRGEMPAVCRSTPPPGSPGGKLPRTPWRGRQRAPLAPSAPPGRCTRPSVGMIVQLREYCL